MQQWSRDGVRQERTGWRDESISQRHRQWGFNCPAVDLDFLVVEYNQGLPVALVEYKRHTAKVNTVQHPTYRALAELANGYKEPLPFLLAFYWPEIWAFRVYPMNQIAGEHFAVKEVVSEEQYVSRLYRMRNLVLDKNLSGKLNTVLPECAAA